MPKTTQEREHDVATQVGHPHGTAIVTDHSDSPTAPAVGLIIPQDLRKDVNGLIDSKKVLFDDHSRQRTTDFVGICQDEDPNKPYLAITANATRRFKSRNGSARWFAKETGLAANDVVAKMNEAEAKAIESPKITYTNSFVRMEYYGAHQQVLTSKDGSITSSGWYDLTSAKQWAAENNCEFIDRRSGNTRADRLEFNERFKRQGLLFPQ